jgi:hypothetical protein
MSGSVLWGIGLESLSLSLVASRVRCDKPGSIVAAVSIMRVCARSKRAGTLHSTCRHANHIIIGLTVGGSFAGSLRRSGTTGASAHVDVRRFN